MADSPRPQPGPSRLQPLHLTDDEGTTDVETALPSALHAVPVDITEEDEGWTGLERQQPTVEAGEPISKDSPAVSDTGGDRIAVCSAL